MSTSQELLQEAHDFCAYIVDNSMYQSMGPCSRAIIVPDLTVKLWRFAVERSVMSCPARCALIVAVEAVQHASSMTHKTAVVARQKNKSFCVDFRGAVDRSILKTKRRGTSTFSNSVFEDELDVARGGLMVRVDPENTELLIHNYVRLNIHGVRVDPNTELFNDAFYALDQLQREAIAFGLLGIAKDAWLNMR